MSGHNGRESVLADTSVTITGTIHPQRISLPPISAPAGHGSTDQQEKLVTPRSSCESAQKRTHRRQPSFPLDPSMFTLELLAGTAAANVRDSFNKRSSVPILTSSSDLNVRPRSHSTKLGRMNGERHVRWSVPNDSTVAEETQSESEEHHDTNMQTTEQSGRRKSQFSRGKEKGAKEETLLAGALERDWTHANASRLHISSPPRVPANIQQKRNVHQRCSSNPEDVTAKLDVVERSTHRNTLSKDKASGANCANIVDALARGKAKKAAAGETHICTTLDVSDHLDAPTEGSERARELHGQGTLTQALSRLELDVGRRNKFKLWSSPKTSPEATNLKDGTQPTRQLPLASRLLAKFAS